MRGINFYKIIRPILFKLDPETSHHLTLKILKWLFCPSLAKRRIQKIPKRPVKVMGLDFPNPIGLAAGLDKNGDYIDALLGLGFGFIEVGAVTPRPQPGHPRPRMFRIPAKKALINRMGFNNKGVDYLVERLKTRRVPGIVGVNIGKNKDTPNEKASIDYQVCFEKVYPFADFVTLNISSPNTANIRDLQGEAYLDNLLVVMDQAKNKLMKQYQRRVPLLVKVSPDLTQQELVSMVNIILQHQVDGIIATNTSLERESVAQYPHGNEQGGLSGMPIFAKSTQVLQWLHELTHAKLPLIGLGGVMSKTDVEKKFQAGASLVQVYTGLIYHGPRLIVDLL